MKKLFEKRSKFLFVCAVLAAIYIIYLIAYFSGSVTKADSAGEALGGAIATALVMPHMIVMLIGTAFAWLGVLRRAPWGACIAGVFFGIGTLLFMMYAMFSIPLLILAFVGYAKQKKMNQIKPTEE